MLKKIKQYFHDRAYWYKALEDSREENGRLRSICLDLQTEVEWLKEKFNEYDKSLCNGMGKVAELSTQAIFQFRSLTDLQDKMRVVEKSLPTKKKEKRKR